MSPNKSSNVLLEATQSIVWIKMQGDTSVSVFAPSVLRGLFHQVAACSFQFSGALALVVCEEKEKHQILPQHSSSLK